MTELADRPLTGRITLTRSEAAASLGISVDTFERWIQPHIRLVRMGRVRLVPVAELENWVRLHAARTLEEAS